jgi:hypothetical protein
LGFQGIDSQAELPVLIPQPLILLPKLSVLLGKPWVLIKQVLVGRVGHPGHWCRHFDPNHGVGNKVSRPTGPISMSPSREEAWILDGG